MLRPAFLLAVALAVALPFALGAAPADAAPARFEIDAVHSSVVFKIGHLGASNIWGRFNRFAGSFSVDEENPAASSVRIDVETASVDTANADRDKHLRSPDFFNAAQFPKITFASTAVRPAEGAEYDVEGDLSLHGVTKRVTVRMRKVGEATHERFGHRVGFEGTIVIKRSDHGMSNMLDLVGDEVTLTVSVEGVAK